MTVSRVDSLHSSHFDSFKRLSGLNEMIEEIGTSCCYAGHSDDYFTLEAIFKVASVRSK